MDYPYIVRTSGTCAGKPRIDGTRIKVEFIAQKVVHFRMSPEEVVTDHPHLTLSQIHSALAYYFDHRDEIEASLREGRRFAEEFRKQFATKLPKLREIDA